MHCHIRWNSSETSSPVSFSAETGSGHTLQLDGSPDGGGLNLGPRPMELLLAGAGACSAYDVVLILQRGRHAIEGCEVQLEAARADNDPKVFTHIEYAYEIRGRNLPRAAVERAVQLSHEKYCSASAMLEKTATLVYRIDLIDTTSLADDE